MIDVHIPKAFQRLKDKARIKLLVGGRGSAKSESVGRYLLLCGKEQPVNVLCCREFQTSIKQSVHSLLAGLISEMGLSSDYRVLETEIQGRNGTKFIYAGVKNNIASIKSMYNIKHCWGEEAQTFSENSLDILIPTIRAEDSEIIFTMNPILPTDPVYERYVLNTSPDCIVMKANYDQNPFFPDVLEKDRLRDLARDPVTYRNIWLGEPREAVAGAVFAEQLRDLQERNGITSVPYDPVKPVNTYWDLGRNDKTAIWFMQQIGGQFRFIRYYESSGEHFSHYIKHLKELPYAYGSHYLPHDATHELLGQEKTIYHQLASAFSGVQEPIKRTQKKALSIDAARSILPNSWFDKELCVDGLNCLRHYAYKVDPETEKTSAEPEHDTPWSHGADAFQTAGMAAQLTDRRPMQKRKRSIYAGVSS